MKPKTVVISSFALIFSSIIGIAGTAGAAQAADTTPQDQLSQWSKAAGQPGNNMRGRALYSKNHGKDLSCASCHSDNPTKQGKHSSTGKVIDPLAPATNPKRFTDTAKVNKWFKRNCNDVLSRECSAQEKADFLAYITSTKT